jgi:hypothetical protein
LRVDISTYRLEPEKLASSKAQIKRALTVTKQNIAIYQRVNVRRLKHEKKTKTLLYLRLT